jgi:surface antigen
MMGKRVLVGLTALLGLMAPAHANREMNSGELSSGGMTKLPAFLECVPYARQVSGIQIRGDAWTWWDQAAGRYSRGTNPRVGAVMAFRPYGKMQLGHVAAVSHIIDSRTVLLRHANWSPINGRRGQIENDVEAVDVSAENDWSEVRVWFDPIHALGTTRWPVAGFIYGKRRDFGAHGMPRGGAASDPIGEIIATYLRED